MEGITFDFVAEAIRPRNKKSHKGTYGHALIIAGSYGKMGAAVIASRACLRTGVGLLTTHVPSSGFPILQTSVPEAMLSIDSNPLFFSDLINLDKFSAIGIGSGIGLARETQEVTFKLIDSTKKPIIIDADGLNCISLQKDFLKKIPPETVLTPHPLEFERLAGNWKTNAERTKKQLHFSVKYNCIVVLKDYETIISTPSGKVIKNTTGNPGMAKGGSGDALTGIITSFLTQGYSSESASLISVFIHGMAGDLAAQKKSMHAMLVSDLIEEVPQVFLKIESRSS